MNNSRLIGGIITVAGLGIAVMAGIWLAGQLSGGDLTSGGAVIGAMLAFVPVALLVGGGLFLLNQGGREQKRTSEMQMQRKLLDIVRSRGQVSVSDLALEMGLKVDDVKAMIHSLVGLQVFSGFINWNDGILYSVDAEQLRALDKCRNCGGALQLAGKGVVTCRFCGTEYFLS